MSHSVNKALRSVLMSTWTDSCSSILSVPVVSLQGYKRPMEPLYPPAKRHVGEAFAGQPFSSQQPNVFGSYAGGGGGYVGPERQPVQGQYPYPYPRDQQGPPQHGMIGSGPPAVSGGPGEGPQANMWHPRSDMGYTYSGQGQGPPYPGMGRGDDQEGRTPQDSQWPPSHPGQRQPPYPPTPPPPPPCPPCPPDSLPLPSGPRPLSLIMWPALIALPPSPGLWGALCPLTAPPTCPLSRRQVTPVPPHPLRDSTFSTERSASAPAPWRPRPPN